MARTVAGYLAGDKAALTKALRAYYDAGDAATRKRSAAKIAEIVCRAAGKGFTRDQVIDGRMIPQEAWAIIHERDGNQTLPTPGIGNGGGGPSGPESGVMHTQPVTPPQRSCSSDDYLEPESGDESDPRNDMS